MSEFAKSDIKRHYTQTITQGFGDITPELKIDTPHELTDEQKLFWSSDAGMPPKGEV